MAEEEVTKEQTPLEKDVAEEEGKEEEEAKE